MSNDTKDTSVILDIPTGGMYGFIEFYPDRIESHKGIMRYSECSSIRYSATRYQVNFSKISTIYKFELKSEQLSVSHCFGGAFYGGPEDEGEKTYKAFLRIYKQHIEPIMLDRLLRQLETTGTIRIGGLEFSHSGCRRLFWWRPNKFVPWNQIASIPQLIYGNLDIFMKSVDGPKVFCRILQETPNHPLIPEIIHRGLLRYV